MKKIFTLLMLFVCTNVMAQEGVSHFQKLDKAYRYRVYFSDKKHNTYSTKRPEAFLSMKALERRKKYRIKVDEFDLPVTPLYLKYLSKNNYKVLNVSKWNNTAVVEVNDTMAIQQLSELTFIKKFKKVWESPDSLLLYPKANRFEQVENCKDTLENLYGKAEHQVNMLNVPLLHQVGFRGEDMTIAVIDGGFYNTDCIDGLKECNILGTKNFVHPNISVFEEPQQHGTMVLSCIASHALNHLVGTAPKANFYLLVSEDNDSENIIEEDNWCAALEYADSLGVDVVTSSLGYYKFNDPKATHQYHELDGKTALNSRSASIAASRGLLLINSAGNEGNSHWKKIGFPADAKNILTVGAVDGNRLNTLFSSVGNTVDGRIKPDVMAQGQNTWVLDCRGNVTKANGTSFSAPLLCGAATCLLQAFPYLKPEEIIDILQKTGDNAEHPNNIYGYGVPDVWKAFNILKK